MKKIFQYYSRFYPLLGGVESHIDNIVQNIKNYDFEILTNALPNYPLTEQYLDNVSIHRFLPYDRNNERFINKTINKILFPYRVWCDYTRYQNKSNYLKTAPFDLLHLHGIYPGNIFIRLNLKFNFPIFKLLDFSFLDQPTIITLHGLFSDLTDDIKVKKITKKYEAFVIDQFENIIVVDRNIQSYLENYIQEMNQDKNIWFIPNSVDTEQFKYFVPVEDGKLKIGFIGRLESSRGLKMLIELIKNLPQYVDLYLVGTGSTFDIEKLKSSVDLQKIHFYTNVKNEQIPEFLHKIDILFNPVVARGISRISLEAMSCGKPAIMLDKGDRYPIMHDITGYLINDSICELIELLQYLQDNRSDIKKIGLNARKIVESEFSNEAIIPKINQIYDSVTS